MEVADMDDIEKLKRWRIISDTLYRTAADMQLKGVAYADPMGQEFHSDLTKLCQRAEAIGDEVSRKVTAKV